MNKKIVKSFILLIIVVIFNISNNELFANTPTISIGAASKNSIKVGQSITYKAVADPEDTEIFNISESNIILKGFTAEISIEPTGTYSRSITFSNIQGVAGSGKSFVLSEGLAVSREGLQSNTINSSSFSIIEAADQIPPVLIISNPNNNSIPDNGTIIYNVTASDNKGIDYFQISVQDITISGFSANVTITGSGNTKTIQFTKIKSTNSNKNKYFTINAGVASDFEGNSNISKTSKSFNIISVEKETASQTINTKINSTTKTKKTNTSSIIKNNTTPKSTDTKKDTPVITNCIDDLNKLGSINKESITLVSWLKSEQTNIKYVQENNYVSKGQVVTYMIDYYNGSTEEVNNAKFEITIPYKVEVQEISKYGSVIQNENSTVVSWNIDNINASSYCRLELKVKYTENTKLKSKQDISEIFYVSLKTTVNNVDSYSYLRQIFIDRAEGKTGMTKSYLTFSNNTNTVRAEEEITRAEFAKMLTDSGIVEISNNSEEYKTLKDYEKIPEYSRDSISALLKNNIMQAFSDGEFKPNNPILMEDAIEIIVKASIYMSNGKLVINNAVFLLNNAITNQNGEVSIKTNYIMEAIRQNIIDKDEIDIDKYVLRENAIKMINALTFRGPYVESLPDSVFRFSDLKENSSYFYDIIGASNNYTYTYNDKLWQIIIKTN